MLQQTTDVVNCIAKEMSISPTQVNTVITLLDNDATVPFIARYRKEKTGGLTDIQLRAIHERLDYLRELNQKRQSILEQIRSQEQLTPALEQAILQANTKIELEDLYLPYRPKRRTKASLAVEAGLLPLADWIWTHVQSDPHSESAGFLNQEKNILNAEAALEGAKQILIERFAEHAGLLQQLRQYMWEHAVLKATAAKQKKPDAAKYSDYFDFSEPLKKIPSHRALALFRGRREQAIQFQLHLSDEKIQHVLKTIRSTFFGSEEAPLCAWLSTILLEAWKTRLSTKLESELLAKLREMADDEAIRVFSRNLRALLLAAPAGHRVTIGLDPGIRTGVKVSVINETGKLLDYTTIYPAASSSEGREDALSTLAKLVFKHHVHFVSIGNGTGSRDTARLVQDLIKRYPDMSLTPVLVNEAGASVYSASPIAQAEFPEIDVTIRGAVSIARRLQDPLAELVKIEPKAIGVGQYQHDVNQSALIRRLHEVVEDCVNLVGVDVNTASVALLTYVAGLNEGLAKNIVAYRDEHGPFLTREQLRAVPRMGEKTFQQCAGFLRIRNGDEPLDASAVHPEVYPLVARMLSTLNLSIQSFMANQEVIKSVQPADYVNEEFGLETIRDVLQELEKPGRDPRPAFKVPLFQEGVEEIAHLKEGMQLEGVVSNVTNFGAFVDIGVHQDGLVHISMLANRFVSDPHTIVRAGDIVQVKVIEVDMARRRIGLSMRSDQPIKTVNVKKTVVRESKPAKPKTQAKPTNKLSSKVADASSKKSAPFNTAMADALAKLKRVPS